MHDSSGAAVGGAARGERRSRLEVLYTVLRLLADSGGLRKTRLMQLANLNSRGFRVYVEEALVSRGLVSREGPRGSTVYRLTETGRLALRLLEALASLGVLGGCGGERRGSTLPAGDVLGAALEWLEGHGFRVLGRSLQEGQGYAVAVAEAPGDGRVRVCYVESVEGLVLRAEMGAAVSSFVEGLWSVCLVGGWRGGRLSLRGGGVGLFLAGVSRLDDVERVLDSALGGLAG